MSTKLSSFSLFPATQEQVLESRCRTAVEWGKGLTLEEYLARDEFTDKQEVARDGKLMTWVLASRSDPTSLNFVCSCETFRREGLIYSQSDAKPKKVACYGIATVFTSPRFRGNGFAGHMMRLLHWVIADASLLPEVFPNEWGLPPPRVADAGEGFFSTLWSDVGEDFYKRCGPTKDGAGWIVREPFSTIWDVGHESRSPGAIKWTWLDENGVMKLWENDTENITNTLSPADSHQASFTFLPHKGVAAFQHWRNYDILQKLVSPPIQHWGIIGDSHTFATWTFEARSPPRTLLVTRLSCSPVDFDDLLAAVMSIARKHSMEKIEVYNVPSYLQAAATRLGGVTVERKEHLPSFKWYGAEKPCQVAWLLNERFCWC